MGRTARDADLVAAGETVVDVPATLASRVRVLSTGRSNKNDPNDALERPGVKAQLHQWRGVSIVGSRARRMTNHGDAPGHAELAGDRCQVVSWMTCLRRPLKSSAPTV